MATIDLFQPGVLCAPVGTAFAGAIVIGERLDGSFAMDFKLPSGVAFDANMPLHVFGWFVVSAAQDIMNNAMQHQVRAKQLNQVDETISHAELERR